MLWILKHLLYLRKTLTAQDTPGQVAAGVALGMMLGVIPKGNLLALILAMLLFGSRANIPAGMLTALVCSCLALVLDPLTHALGDALLSAAALQPIWNTLYDQPLLPWTAFNNTVVLGSTLVSLAAAWPTYATSLVVVRRWRKRLEEKEQQEEATSETVPAGDTSARESSGPAGASERQSSSGSSRGTASAAGSAAPLDVPHSGMRGMARPCSSWGEPLSPEEAEALLGRKWQLAAAAGGSGRTADGQPSASRLADAA